MSWRSSFSVLCFWAEPWHLSAEMCVIYQVPLCLDGNPDVRAEGLSTPRWARSARLNPLGLVSNSLQWVKLLVHVIAISHKSHNEACAQTPCLCVCWRVLVEITTVLFSPSSLESQPPPQPTTGFISHATQWITSFILVNMNKLGLVQFLRKSHQQSNCKHRLVVLGRSTDTVHHLKSSKSAHSIFNKEPSHKTIKITLHLVMKHGGCSTHGFHLTQLALTAVSHILRPEIWSWASVTNPVSDEAGRFCCPAPTGRSFQDFCSLKSPLFTYFKG